MYVIVGLPAATAVSRPVLTFIVALVPSELVHDPPVIALLSVFVAPTHRGIIPVIAGGFGFTVIKIVL